MSDDQQTAWNHLTAELKKKELSQPDAPESAQPTQETAVGIKKPKRKKVKRASKTG